MTTLSKLSNFPDLKGLVLLIGPPGAGKSTFAQKLIAQHIIDTNSYISNDKIAKELFGLAVDRGGKDGEIFAEQDRRLASLLQINKVGVIDATNVKSEARQRLIAIARQFDAPVTAICFKRDEATLLKQNEGREAEVPEEVVREYALLMQHVSPDQLKSEGIEKIIDIPRDILL